MGPLIALVCDLVLGKLCLFVKFGQLSSHKKVNVFIFEKRVLQRRCFWPLYTFLSHKGKMHKNSFGTYLTYINTNIQLTLLTFLPYQFCKNYEFMVYGFSLERLLVLIHIHTILEQTMNNKMVSKIYGGKFTTNTYLPVYTNSKFVVICKNADFEKWLVKIRII